MDTTRTSVHWTRVCAVGDFASREATTLHVQPAVADLGSATMTGQRP
jgi:hypothetical protein